MFELIGRRFAGIKVAVALLVFAMGFGFAAEEEDLIVSSEVEGRKVIIPTDLNMALDWYAPRVGLENGKIIKGWVKKNVILLLTDRNALICVERANGTEKWRADLTEAPRYAPAVSKSNVLLNIKNYLVAIHMRTGRVRWRLMPKFVMSTAPMVIDPPTYFKRYTNKWKPMESVYVSSWNGRFNSLTVEGRISKLLQLRKRNDNLSAPEFSLYYSWHRSQSSKGISSTPVRHYEGTLYYVSDDNKIYGVTRDNDPINPYMMQSGPCTDLEVDALNCYVGCRDFSLYALNRLTLRKKWTYPMGTLATGRIFADEPGAISYVFVPTETEGVHALKIVGIKKDKSLTFSIPETAALAWKVPEADGALGASERNVYLGFDSKEDFPGFAKVAAVDKASGKVLWKSESKGVLFYIESQNAWMDEDEPLRLYAVTADNRLLSFKERTGGAGPLVEVEPIEVAAEEPVVIRGGERKVPGAAQAMPE